MSDRNQGLADNLMSHARGEPSMMEIARSVAEEMERQQWEWIADLRAAGVKAAHPDDAWVNRERNLVKFVYPQFNDGAGVGDLVALGCPPWNGEIQHRIVRLTGFRPGIVSDGSWTFEPVSQRAE